MFKGERHQRQDLRSAEKLQRKMMSRLIMLWVCSCEWLKQEVNLAPVSYILFIHSMYCMNSLNSEPFVGRDTLKMSAFIHVKWEINTAASSVGSVCMFRYWVQLCFLYSRAICLSCMLQLNIFLRRKGRVRNVWKSGSGEDSRKTKEKKEEEVDLVSTHRVAETIATSEMITRCQSMKGLFSQRLSH